MAIWVWLSTWASFGFGDVALGVGLVDFSLLADGPRVVGAEVLDEVLLVGDVLDIARNDAQAEGLHVLLGLVHDFVAELVAVDVDVAQREGADDFAHVALQRVLHLLGDVGTVHVQEVLGGEAHPFDVGDDLDFGHGVDVDIDEVVGGHAAAGLDVGGHLAQEHLVQSLQQRHTQSALTNVDTRLAVESGDDVGHRRRRFDVGNQDDEQYDDCHDDDGNDDVAHNVVFNG